MKKPKLEYHCVSYQGKRKKNEDVSFVKINNKFRIKQVIIGVADGMGGYEKGNIASRMAVSEMEKVIEQNIPLDPQQASNMVVDSIERCNEAVYSRGRQSNALTMGTTLTGAVLKGNQFLVFNVGDSRTYRVTPGGISQVTEDHSADVDDFKNGIISREEVGKGFYSHALSKSIGTDQTIEPDIFPVDSSSFYTLQEGEVIFSCTDGMWGVLTENEFYDEIVGRESLKESFESLAALAYLKGSSDNISIAGLEYGELKRKQLGLKRYPPLKKIMNKHAKTSNRRLLSLLLVISVIGFVITSYFIYNLIKGNGYSKKPKRVKPDAIQEERLKPRPQVQEKTGKRIDYDLRIKPDTTTHVGKVRVEILVKKFRVENFPVENPVIYYSTGGTPGEYHKPFVLERSATVTVWAVYRLGDAEYRTGETRKRYKINPIPGKKPAKKVKQTIETVNDVKELDQNTRSELWRLTRIFRLKVKDIKSINGEIKVGLSVKSSGVPDRAALNVEMEGLKVIPVEKKTIIKNKLQEKIRKLTFPSPLKKGKMVNLENFRFNLRVKSFKDTVILSREK